MESDSRENMDKYKHKQEIIYYGFFPTSSSICPQTLAMSSSLSVVLNRASSTSAPNSLTKLDSAAWCWDLSIAGEWDFSNVIFWRPGDCNFPGGTLGDPASTLGDLIWPRGEALTPDLVPTCCDPAWPTTDDPFWTADVTDWVVEGLNGVFRLLRVRRPGVFCAVMFWYGTQTNIHTNQCSHWSTNNTK